MNFEKIVPTRDGFGDEIVELGRENKDILVVDADIGKSCKTGAFRKALPEQYLNVGIAEQNCAGVAAGLATCGKIPFVVTYAAFGSMRMLEMIRQEICYPHLNVKIACSHGGVTPANDGASHQAIEDMGILRTVPNMTVVMPADYWSARKLVRAAAEFDGPVYLRFTRDAVPVIYNENDTFELGKAKQLRNGGDVAIIANGDIWKPEDAERILLHTGADMAMIGRGCFGNPWIFQQAKAVLEGQPVSPLPPLAERCETAVRQIRMAASYKGERVAVLEARKQYCWYLKGIPHANYYKEQIVQMNTLEDVDRITKGIQRDLRD